MSRMFGSINQIGYVVRDIDAAMDRWVRHGVGPWFYIGDVTVDYFRYRGADSDLKMSVALANSGDLQLELIQQRNDAPPMYKDFLDRAGHRHRDQRHQWPQRATVRLHSRGSRVLGWLRTRPGARMNSGEAAR